MISNIPLLRFIPVELPVRNFFTIENLFFEEACFKIFFANFQLLYLMANEKFDLEYLTIINLSIVM